ncbi:MAG TPA: DedA family protein [Candidatus Binatia bacterium]|nr:DedA family protein [Candidatus Binatia bacterium]
MADWIIGIIERTGYLGIVALMFVENVFPPIPSEVIVPLAGFLASKGELNLIGAILAGTTGSVLGAVPLYYAGVSLSEERLRRFAEKHGRWLTISPEDLGKAKRWFDKHGALAVLICRLVPAVRSIISIPAGMARMPFLSFLCFTTLGAAAWTTLLASAGYLLGAKFEAVNDYLNPVSYVVLAVILAVYIKWLLAPRS